MSNFGNPPGFEHRKHRDKSLEQRRPTQEKSGIGLKALSAQIVA